MFLRCIRWYWNKLLTLFSSLSDVSFSSLGQEAQSITAALRDLYKSMDLGKNVPPLVLLNVLHNAFPRFAEKSEHGGGYQQQDANECWIELLGMLKQKLPSKDNERVTSAIDQYFGLDFETETKCVESDDEPVVKGKEHFLQYNCYIDKDVKYLHSGLMNVRIIIHSGLNYRTNG